MTADVVQGLAEIKRLVDAGFDLPLREGLQREREGLLRVPASDDYAEELAAPSGACPASPGHENKHGGKPEDA